MTGQGKSMYNDESEWNENETPFENPFPYGSIYNPTGGEPDGGQQPREHAVITPCRRWTMNISGKCGLPCPVCGS